MRAKLTMSMVLCLVTALIPSTASARFCNEDEFLKQSYTYTTEEFTGELAFDPKCLDPGVRLVYEYFYGRSGHLDGEDGGGRGACTRKNRKCAISFALAHLPVEQSRYYFTLTVDLYYRGSLAVSGDGYAEWTCTSAVVAAFCD